MRQTLAATSAFVFGLFAVATPTGQLPLRQHVEILGEGPIRADTVKDGLYVTRGPFLPCTTWFGGVAGYYDEIVAAP